MNLKLTDRRTDYLLIAVMAAALVLIFLTAWAMAGEVTLAWDYTDFAKIDGFKVYQDGVKIADVVRADPAADPPVSWHVTGLADGKHYCWYVTAFKGAYKSLPSNTVCVTWSDTQVIELPAAPAQLILKFK